MACQNKVTFADTPFVLDAVVPIRPRFADRQRLTNAPRPDARLRPGWPDGEVNLIDYLNETLPWAWLQEYVPPTAYPGRNLGGIAHLENQDTPDNRVLIGDFFYPNTARRWSVFRGLATSSQVKAMVAAALDGGSTAQPLVIVGAPQSPDNPGNLTEPWTLTTPMHLLPPRPLKEHGGSCDGLYLVTLVDERYYWQFLTATLRPTITTTWSDLISQVGAVLSAPVSASVEADWLQPEADSPLWCNAENAAVLMDALAENVGRTFVRSLGASYSLQTTAESLALTYASRGPANRVVRLAGGDLFYSGGKLPAGPLAPMAKNAVVPETVTVTFPQYVYGDDPVPHFISPRTENQRPSTWFQDSYGAVLGITCPLASGDFGAGEAVLPTSGGDSLPAKLFTGVTGHGSWTIQTTAKALYTDELALSTDPENIVDLRKLAVKLTQSYCQAQGAGALDEVYPGTYAWTPEGLHDIVWTYAASRRQISTRVMRSPWNQGARTFQHSMGETSVTTNTPRGVGGPLPAWAARDAYETAPPALALAVPLWSGDQTINVTSIDCLPTQDRWRADIGFETLLLEGTSGGLTATSGFAPRTISGWMVSVVYRAIDGSKQFSGPAGTAVAWTQPDATYGDNLLTAGPGFFLHQAAWTSGGIGEAKLLCPLRTVQVFDGSGAVLNGRRLYSGCVENPLPAGASGARYGTQELIWVEDRNTEALRSGQRYGGQLAGYSVSGPHAPLYLVNDQPTSGGSSTPVKLNVRDSYALSGFSNPTLNGSFNSGAATATLNRIDNLPTDYRWEALIDSEWILFEGTSGGATIGVASRGLNGTTEANHANGTTVAWQLPQRTSGIDSLAFGPGFLVQPGTPWNSGTNEATVLCPTRTVRLLSASGATFSGKFLFSGEVVNYNTAVAGASLANNSWADPQPVWIRERNGYPLISGAYYDGQLVGWTASGTAAGNCAPLYLVDATPPIYVTSGTPGQANYFTMTASGLSEDAYVQIGGLSFVTSGSAAGLQWWGGIKNTSGVNALDVRYTWHDVWGNEYTVERLGLSPGDVDSFNAAVFSGSLGIYGLGTNSGIIEVKSNVAGQPTGWALRSTYF